MPKVNYQREEVTALTPRWDLIRDCISGEKAIKDKGIKYLPKPNSTDISNENTARYEQYKLRAVFYGVTGRTLEGLVGQVFARDPVLAIPDAMDLLTLDIDGGGVSLDQQARKALSSVLSYGRAFILVDYPKTEAPASKAEIEQGHIKPTITMFDPWDVINWRIRVVGSKKLLSLVVISEKEVTDDDGFEACHENYFRVLRLNDAGVYQSEIWYFDDKLNDFVLEEMVIPLDHNGQPWREIPGTFIGSKNNDSTPDLPPLYDLAVINIAHYRNSADYEESAYMVGQPTPWFAGLTQEWIESVFKGGAIQLGSRAAVPLPEGASAGLLQAEPNTMPKEAMELKENQMVALGAKLVEQKSVQRTAKEAGMDEASNTSILATAANNVSHAYTAALKWCAQFMGIEFSKETDISYALNTDFDISRLPAQEVAAVIAAWQANAIPFEEMRDYLKRGGIAYLDDEEAKTLIAEAGIDLGMPVGSPASAAAAAADAKAKADAAAAKNGGKKDEKPVK